ncbi:MAG: xanthine dehydrogenase family protein molybdopterin-binding subunit [Candidatus Marinimicrobia bacterium]|nr:hypothetical protein [Candidatus Neomarinimicrobiota bacterium]MDP6456269.1 xanthine dehydrogenase family protein molybdopterin-binding subunit [Candidatus Neomarinimicrobiota bacterium]MDP6593557.1 xanthine dehydrogenase family protein molybdopterin-binding subunit [Candidatus Neomarinimicrobiota bacterium]MDP6836341.1 xanthine dehydrogenase family protein molybdopterin-binding subunit [Candidatus Neomarinimicrobiota bacterium]MDP6967060.1 xanthine dehydrogenase family protein molybdopterin
MAEQRTISRRDFIKVSSATGAGLVIGFYLPAKNRLLATGIDTQKPFQPNVWIAVNPDNSVTLTVGRSEMGQGVRTSLPMIIAEEMNLDWSQVRVVQASAHPDRYGSQSTGGSQSIRKFWEPLRKAGATAREMLLQAAAKQWKVDKSECYTEDGAVIHRNSGKKLSYGDLTKSTAKLPIPKQISLKNTDEFRLIGKNIPRTDTVEKVDGTARFAMDIKIPGMVHATVVRCPVFGGRLKSFDAKEAMGMNGVLDVFKVEKGLAIVAESTWKTFEARRSVEISWDEGPNTDLDSSRIDEMLITRSKRKGAAGRKEGNAEKALKESARVVEAVYEAPFQAHATMEPMCCVADVKSDTCRVWAPTQSPQHAQKDAAKIAGLPLEKVELNVTFLGGGFGRRSFNDFVSDAVEISKRVAKPVKLLWTREDDMQHDYYRPVSRHILRGGLNEQGDVIALAHRVVAPSIIFSNYVTFPVPFKEKLDKVALEGAKDIAYNIPNILVDYKMTNTAIPVGWWRSVYDSQNAFASECFIDELASAAGEDPFKFRLELLSDSPRDAGVLRLAAEKSDWDTKAPIGRYRGISCHASFGSYVAQVAEVSLRSDSVTVHRVICAVDCGQVVNPSIVETQIESGIVYGLCATLKGEITIEKGRVVQSNFHDFPLLQIDEMPKIEVYVMDSSEPPTGVGEPGLPPIAPAVANAVFAATGKRVRKLPIRMGDLPGA